MATRSARAPKISRISLRWHYRLHGGGGTINYGPPHTCCGGLSGAQLVGEGLKLPAVSQIWFVEC